MITGNITPSVIEFPLFGRPAIIAVLKDSTGTAIELDDDFYIVASIFRNSDDDTPVLSKTTEDGGVLVLETLGYIYIPFAALDIVDVDGNVILSSQWVYDLRVSIFNVSDDSIQHVNVFSLLPVNNPQLWSLPTVVNMSLSIKFVNTPSIVDYVGGSGYLDGLATINQTVGCWITFTRAGAQPEEWELIVWTDSSMNTSSGIYQQPTDFNASTNAKVWVRRS